MLPRPRHRSPALGPLLLAGALFASIAAPPEPALVLLGPLLVAAGRLKNFRACCASVKKLGKRGISIDREAAELLEARREDLDQLVRWQIKKASPFPLEEALVTSTPGARGATPIRCCRRTAKRPRWPRHCRGHGRRS